MTTPLQGSPIKFQRTVTGQYDIVCDGINPSVGSFNFSLNDLPNSTDFTNLFDMYRIDKVEIEFYPEYTELTDAALVSNAVNVLLNSAVDPVAYAISTVNDVLQFSTLVSTPITKCHKRKFEPAIITASSQPCRCFISTQSPSTNWYGLAYGVPPTGVAMVLRSRARFYLSMALAR